MAGSWRRLYNKIKSLAKKYRVLLLYWGFILILFILSGELIAATLNSGPVFLSLVALIIASTFFIVPICLIISIKKKAHRFFTISTINLMVTILFVVIAFEFPEAEVTNLFRGTPKIVAYYQGTQNQAKLTLRENNNFDIWWTGFFFSSTYIKGQYTQENDEFTLDFEGEIPRNFNGKAEIVTRLSRTGQPATYFRFYTDDEFEYLDFFIRPTDEDTPSLSTP